MGRATVPAAGNVTVTGGVQRQAICQTPSMRAALFEEPGTDLVVVDDVEIEDPHAGEVRVRVSYCGVCHSDLHFVDGQLPSPVPAILGHEAAGVVEQIGAGVESLAVGDKVILTLQPQCGRCYFCARGEVHLCVTGTSLATGALPDGGTRLSHRGRKVFRGVGLGGFAVVGDLSGERCDQGCRRHAARRGLPARVRGADRRRRGAQHGEGPGGRDRRGDRARWRRHRGGAGCPASGRRPWIFGVDPVASRREQAVRFGVTDLVDPSTDDLASLCMDATAGVGVDHALDTAATSATMTACVQALRSGGQLTVVGVPPLDATISVPLIAWALAEKTVTGSFLGSSNPHREFPRLLSLWRAGRLDLEGMVTSTRPLTELPAAFADMKAGTGLRTVIHLGD